MWQGRVISCVDDDSAEILSTLTSREPCRCRLEAEIGCYIVRASGKSFCDDMMLICYDSGNPEVFVFRKRCVSAPYCFYTSSVYSHFPPCAGKRHIVRPETGLTNLRTGFAAKLW